MDPIVAMEGVTYSYPTRKTVEHPSLLQDFSIRITPQEIVAMVGPSACGKSTIARLIAGLLFPKAGKVLFNGQPVRQPSRERGLIAQGDWCLPWFTVRKNIHLGLAKPLQDGQLDHLLRVAGLAGSLDKYPAELSFGARQRVCLVRALVAGADVLLLDEPLSSVDAVRKLSLEQSIRATLKAANVSALWITHDLDEALLVADRLIVVGKRPLGILYEEEVLRTSEQVQLTISTPEFQKRRLALHNRVAALWPSEGGMLDQ